MPAESGWEPERWCKACASTDALARLSPPHLPAAVVPPNATLTYEVELVRLSRRGPEALFTGVSQCGPGFAMERSAGCADISTAEYV